MTSVSNARRRTPRDGGLGRGRGFTLIELLVAVTVMGLIATLGMPALMQMVHRTKMEGINRQTGLLFQQARLESIKRGVPAVVMIEPTLREVVAFVDVHGAASTDPSDGLFNPLGGLPVGGTDFEFARYPLPSGVDFAFLSDTGLASVDGFINTGNPDPPDSQVIFKSNGSAFSDGALRFGDVRGNYLEVRVSPASTARVQIRKWNGAEWLAANEGGSPWAWH